MTVVRRPDILCISSIDWDFIWQGHQEIMSRLAAEGHRVLFVENTGVLDIYGNLAPLSGGHSDTAGQGVESRYRR